MSPLSRSSQVFIRSAPSTNAAFFQVSHQRHPASASALAWLRLFEVKIGLGIANLVLALRSTIQGFFQCPGLPTQLFRIPNPTERSI